MVPMTTLPLSDVKARLSEIADEVDRTHERVHITKNGRDYVVLVSAEDLESIEATIELLSDPAAQRRPRQDRKSTRLNSSHANISYAVFCLKKNIDQPRSEEDDGLAVHHPVLRPAEAQHVISRAVRHFPERTA